MTGTARKRIVWALGLVLATAFAVAAHVAIVDGFGKPAVGAWLSLIPVTALAFWAVRRSRRPPLAILAVVAAIVAVWIDWPVLERHFPSLFFIEHAGANFVLAIVFGRTLTGNREALCTRFARLLHGTLPPEVTRYTRQLTLAWTLFFVAIFGLSSVLYLGGWRAEWSLLANFLSPVLIAAMFGFEYLVRRRLLPHWKHAGVLSGIRAFANHLAVAQPEVPR